MSSTGSITRWIEQLRAGDAAAFQPLWERYFERLVRLARRKLRGSRRRVEDEEDVALSALDSFWRGAKGGRFTKLRDRHNLWPLLIVITARKAHDVVVHERRQKRGGGAVRGESVFQVLGGLASSLPGLDQVVGSEPTPEDAERVAEGCRRLLDQLPDEQLRSVALWRMEGYTNAEIAKKLARVEGTVERKLRMIRSIWAKEIAR